MPSTSPAPVVVPPLRTARVLRVEETGCEVWSAGEACSAQFAPTFPSPRVERVSPGHLVAVAAPPTGPAYQDLQPGERAYASAGLPGADWWVAGRVVIAPESADVDLDEVRSMYDDNNLWSVAFEPPA